MSPNEFITAAYVAVCNLQDSTCGTQMHRRAATGRELRPFVHSTGVVTMRLDGQYVDVGVAWHGDNHPHAPGKAAGDAFAAQVTEQLSGMAPPVPGEIYERPKRGGARPVTREDDARLKPDYDKREVYTCRLPRWLVRKLREMPEAGKTIEAALLASGEFKRPESK